MSNNEAIVLYQPLLQAIALKMVGTLEDAEDIVQDTFEKWLKVDTSKIENARAYLIRSVSNNCLNFLNSFWSKVINKEVVDLSEVDIEDRNQGKSIFGFDLESQLSEAWAVVHRKLEPLEKQVFILREVFNIEYDELQLIFDKTKDNCRQIVSRARVKIKKDKVKTGAKPPSTTVPVSFVNACKMGNISSLLEELKS